MGYCVAVYDKAFALDVGDQLLGGLDEDFIDVAA